MSNVSRAARGQILWRLFLLAEEIGMEVNKTEKHRWL
jgi:hypothetical protein